MKGFSIGSGIAYAGVCCAGAGIIICQMCFNAPWWAYIFPALMIIGGTEAIEKRTPKDRAQQQDQADSADKPHSLS